MLIRHNPECKKRCILTAINISNGSSSYSFVCFWWLETLVIPWRDLPRFAPFCRVLPRFVIFLHGHQGHLRRPPVLRDRSSYTGGRWDNAGRCFCASGAALATPEGRAGRLLDLTANEGWIPCGGAGADPDSEIVGFFENSLKWSIFKVLCFAWNLNSHLSEDSG